MPFEVSKTNQFDHELYERAFGDFVALRSRLPETAIESLAREVMARLVSRVSEEVGAEDAAPPEDEIERLCHALISEDRDAAMRMIDGVRRDGVSLEVVYLSYLGRAAQRLGTWWEEDIASFAEVTIGTSRVYAIMRALRAAATPANNADKSAVFASVPGDTHTLGVTMATELFRKRGWTIDLKLGLPHDDLIVALSQSPYAVIGLSASGEKSLAALARLIVALRVSNPGSLILVSGHIVETEAETLAMLGVDGMAPDFHGALSEMNRLLARSIAERPG